jgi:hypothetical protein
MSAPGETGEQLLAEMADEITANAKVFSIVMPAAAIKTF